MMNDAPLGKPTDYVDQYDPGLLFPITRAENRESLGLSTPIMAGLDINPFRSNFDSAPASARLPRQ